MKPYGTEFDCKIPIQQIVLIICSSSSYLPSSDLVQSLGGFFLADITRTLTTAIPRLNISTMHTKVDLQIAQCVHGIGALQSSSLACVLLE